MRHRVYFEQWRNFGLKSGGTKLEVYLWSGIRPPLQKVRGPDFPTSPPEIASTILSVESNQNVDSKTEKYGVQNSIFTSRNKLLWALTHLVWYDPYSSTFQIWLLWQYYAIS